MASFVSCTRFLITHTACKSFKNFLSNFRIGGDVLLERLQKLVGSQRITSHKDLLIWVINTWQSLTGIKSSGDQNQVMNEATEAESITEDKEAERKRLAAERRKKVMDQMKNAQKNFMKENKQLYDDTVQKRQRLNTEGNQDDSNQEMMEDVVQCLGNIFSKKVYTCKVN